MKHTRLIPFILFLFPLLASAQTPTFVQHVSCPNSRNTGNQQSNTPDYNCPLPEPTQAGNTIIAGIISTSGPTFTMSDDKSNSWSLVNSFTDGNNNTYVAIYVARNVAAGTRRINLHRSTYSYIVSMSVSEYYNVGAVDVSGCHQASSATITAGSVTPTVSGDLIWQWAAQFGGNSAPPNSVSSFAAGSQSNIAWQLLGTDLYDGDATQAGVYSSTAAINPTFTSGSSENFISCAVALKAASQGQQNPQAFRVLHMLHQQHPKSAANPFLVQFPASGNLIVNSYISGGSNISSMSSAPANTWLSTGPQAGGGGISALSQIYYAGNASTANSMTLSVSRNDNTSDGTFMLYDIIGAAASPFDTDSGGQNLNQTSEVNPLVTCSASMSPACTFAPTTANELVIANAGWNWGTATACPSPSGCLFDVATDTGNSVDGPQSVDQNNGWLHFYDPNTNPVTVSWTISLDTAESWWAGRVAAFKPGSSVSQQPAPPTQLSVVVN